MNKIQKFGFIIGLLGFIFFNIYSIFPNNLPASNLLAIVFLIVSFWIFEVIPLAVTSLLPFILFPIFGIMKADNVASYYFNSTIFLFLGGFLLASAIENWQLHKRISLIITDKIGKTPDMLIFGIMTATTFLSMFISNAATAIMMMPIGLSVIKKIEQNFDKKNADKMTVSLMLGIAYSASIGGIATIIGTAPNLAFKRIYEQSFPDAPEITFTKWMFYALPITLVMLILIWVFLTQILHKVDKSLKLDRDVIKKELKELGNTTYQEKLVFAITILAAFLWIFRADIELGSFVIYGWSNLFNFSKFIDDGLIAIFIALLLFVMPSIPFWGKNINKITQDVGTKKHLLSSDALNTVPWDILVLLGGGFALAQGFQVTGFSKILGENLTGINSYGVIGIVIIVSTLLTFLTELTSNTATTNTVLPILAGIAIATNINPLILMLPATISASFAFMLPVGTPPNSIVFSVGVINIRQMATAGFIINIIGIIVVTFFTMTTGKFIFDF